MTGVWQIKRALRYLLRKFYLLLAICVIVLAVLVQLGRNFSYLAADYQPQLTEYFAARLQGEVSLGSLHAEWEGLQPVLDVTDVHIANQQGEQILVLESARLRLDLQASLLQRELVWGNLSFVGADMALQQLADGRWHLRGAETGSLVNEGVYQRLVDIMLAAKRIAFEQTRFSLAFYQGETVTLDSPSLLLENRGDFHRLQLQVGLSDHSDALFFIAEAQGDPRQQDSAVNAYLQLRNVPTDTPMAALSALLAGSVEGLPIEVHGGRLDASLWLARRPRQSDYQILGELALGAFSLTGTEGDVGIMDGFSAAVSGHFQHPGLWDIGLHQGDLWVGDARFSDWSLGLSSAQDEALQIRVDAVDLGRLEPLVMGSRALTPYPRLEELLTQLQPQGRLQNLWLRLPFTAPKDWSLAANLQQVGISSWGQVPAFNGVSGYVYATARGGYVQIDTGQPVSALFADVYSHPLVFDSARGQVAWSLRPEDNQIYINSGRVTLREGTEHAEGYFWLSLPWQRNTGDIDLSIYLGAKQVKATQYQKYVPALLPDAVTEWIADSVGKDNPGVATAGGFLFRGTINTSKESMRTLQMTMDVEQGELDYFPGWPELKEITGSLLIDDKHIIGRLDHGRVYNSDITAGHVNLDANPQGEGLLLKVAGEVDGLASDGLRMLRQSLLRQYVGDLMDSWYLHGDLDARIALAIPLSTDQPGMHQSLQMDVNASSFALDNFNLELSDFSGRISYESERGITSENLTAGLFEKPVNIVLDTRESAGALATTIDVNTRVHSRHLAEWTAESALDFIDGEIPLDVHIAVNHSQEAPEKNGDDDRRRAAVGIVATLDEVRVDLPAPVGKPVGEPRELLINYILGTETALADVRYGDSLRGMLLLDQRLNTVRSAVIGNGPDLNLPLESVVAIKGRLPTLDIPAWQAAYKRYQSMREKKVLAEAAQPPLPLQLDITLDEYATGPLQWKDLRLQGRQLSDGWDLLFSGDQVAGEVFWPTDEKRHVRLHLERLALDKQQLLGDGENSESSLETQKVADDLWQQLRPADVRIDALTLDGEEYGNWQFVLKPYRDQLALLDIEGSIRGLEVGATEHGGAYLLWYNTPSDPYTGISARLRTGDLGQVMEAWGLPKAIESDVAVFDANLYWRAAPQDIGLAIISGPVMTTISDGRFLNTGDSTGQGLLRLMGLFNFDSIARRLRLDFSDLYKSGLTFDEITGEVTFADGFLHVTQPMVLESPSSQMQMSGQVNLREELLDMRLVATLPVTGNLTVITALAAGLPAAAGVFLISKIFEREMKKMASVSYTITGDWDDPKMEFDRLFDADPE